MASLSELFAKLKKQNFGVNDSLIASTVMHPSEAAKRFGNKFSHDVNTAAGLADLYDNPNPLYAPSEDQQAKSALDLAGLMQTGAFPFAPSGEGTLGSIKAYHGTPYSFDKFDMSKIGTGEGAQAYGHGLYFAGNPAVANEYMKVKPSIPLPPRRLFQGQELDPGTPEYRAARLVQDTPLLKARKEVQGWIDDISGIPERAKDVEGYRRTLEILNRATSKKDFKTENPKPKLYEVSIEWPDKAREASNPMGPEHFLDWDKPISQQSPFIQDIINKQLPGNGDKLGEDLYWSLAHGQPASEKSKILREMGIPGLRYLDQGSRKAGEGTSNYVTFSDLIPNIINRR